MPDLQTTYTSPSGWLRVEPIQVADLALSLENPPLMRVTISRPDVRNAFNETLITEIAEAFIRLSQNPELRAVVFATDGPTFCAGADLDWMRRSADFTAQENLRDAEALAAMLQAIRSCPALVVARVQGSAFGGGVGLIAACDIALAVEKARFCLSEVKLGLVPSVISPYVLSKIGVSAAQRYFVTAEDFSAQEARRIGLIHEMADDETALDAQLESLLKTLLANAPGAMAASKRLVQYLRDDDLSWPEVTAMTTQLIAERRSSTEGHEGIRSFLEKRSANWVLWS